MFKNFLSLSERKVSGKELAILILISFIFSIAIRMIWVYQFDGIENFKWNNQLMINTNDGYYWAEGARDILREQKNYISSPVNSAISEVTALLAKVLPISFETLILYLPAVFGSLLVVPIILMGHSIKQSYLGFVASLVGGIAWSYYNRTMVGYYDTDMLTIVLPTFALWSIIFAVTEQKNRWLFITAFFMLLYSYWYGGSYSLNLSMAIMVFLYTVIFDRKAIFNYKLVSFILIAIAPITLLLKLLLFIGIFFIYHKIEHRDDKFQKFYDFLESKKIDESKLIFIILIITGLIVLLTGGFAPVLAQLKGYVFREAVAGDIALKYFNVAQTVREAGQIPFEMFANRISGHTITFIIATIGYILLCLRYKIFLLALPMVGLGFLALKGGLRFTVYTVPIHALGLAYFIFLVAKYIESAFNEKIKKGAKIVTIAVLCSASLYPNIIHVIGYKVPVVFDKSEVEILDKLKEIADRDDFVLTWWDYGYPIRYYSDVNTLVDGGKHDGSVNYPVSFALTYPNLISSANMARLNVEYTKKGFSSIDKIVEDYGFSNPNAFLKKIASKDFKLPEKTSDIYYYLPLRMLDIFPTVKLFSNLDLVSGITYQNPNFFQATARKEDNQAIYLNNGFVILKPNAKINVNGKEGVVQELSLQVNNQIVPIKNFIITAYGADGKLVKQAQKVNEKGVLSIVFMQSYGKFLILDDSMLSSSYIRLFVLEDFDSELFEPVILNPLVKVFKLKR